MQKISAPLRPKGAEQQQNYLNFYGNLMKANDAYLVQVLDTLEEQGLLDNTLVIFTSDHGSPAVNPDWQGVDYSALLLHPTAPGVQDYQVFTYDDWQAAQAQGPYVTGANHIVAVRDDRYTLARYYAPDGNAPDEWEMYDRQADPNQKTNLVWTGVTHDADQEAAYQRLLALVEEVENTRLQPLN